MSNEPYNPDAESPDRKPPIWRKLFIIAASIALFVLIAAAALVFLAFPYVDRDRMAASEEILLVEEDQNLVELTLQGVMMDNQINQPVVLLKEEDGNKYLPIWIGTSEAIAISLELAGTKMPRPMTHDLMIGVLEGLDASVDSIIITKMEQDTFYAVLRLRDRNDHLLDIDSRPSDAIAVAARVQCQIMVVQEVLDSSGIEVDPAEDQFERLRI